MCSKTPPARTERYAIEDAEYVLYMGHARVLVTRSVAVLIDTRLGVLITHGDPASVRCELDEMRHILRTSCAEQYDRDWLLLEGHPQIDALNQALRNPSDIDMLKGAFSGEAERNALHAARSLIARASRND